MSTPGLKLVPKLNPVPTERVQLSPDHSSERQSLYAPWKQEFRGLSQLASTLTGLLLGAILLSAFLYAYNVIQRISTGQAAPEPVNSSLQEFVALTNVNIHSEPNSDKNTRIGICEQGARIQIIGTQVIGRRVWYEIKILSQHPENLDSASHMWVAAEYLTMLRQ